MPHTGIIAGSGFYDIEGVELRELRKITTPYGDPSDLYRICVFSDIEFVFLSRHGAPHHIPPHRINYRANIWGFRELGIDRIISVNAVGAITPQLKPGDIVIPDQIIDLTSGRESTFYDGPEVVHVDFTDPLCPELRQTVLRAAHNAGMHVRSSGTYTCVNGPRLETRREIEYFAQIGTDVVGMTVMPEAALARELELCFAGIAVATNFAAGISPRKLTTTEVVETMGTSTGRIKDLIFEALRIMPSERGCDCPHALKGARL